jgi:hypothetical protein
MGLFIAQDLGIETGDGFGEHPPYTRMETPRRCGWVAKVRSVLTPLSKGAFGTMLTAPF